MKRNESKDEILTSLTDEEVRNFLANPYIKAFSESMSEKMEILREVFTYEVNERNDRMDDIEKRLKKLEENK